jgi:hypothetical protein
MSSHSSVFGLRYAVGVKKSKRKLSVTPCKWPATPGAFWLIAGDTRSGFEQG